MSGIFILCAKPNKVRTENLNESLIREHYVAFSGYFSTGQLFGITFKCEINKFIRNKYNVSKCLVCFEIVNFMKSNGNSEAKRISVSSYSQFNSTRLIPNEIIS